MRRASALLAVPLIAAAAFVAGCSSTPANPNASVTASGKFGAAPKVTIPAQAAGKSLYSKDVIQGKGTALTSSDSFVGNYQAYDWSGKKHKLLMSTYTTHTPSLFPSKLLPGLSSALKGAKEGSRVVAVIPPKEGFGPQGNPQLGVKGGDTLVFVLDVMKAVSNTASASGQHVSDGGGSLAKVTDPKSGQAPTITVPKSSPPNKLTVTPLIKGKGPKIGKGQAVIVQYTGSIWRTGKTFSSSWAQKTPFEYVSGSNPPQVIPGWDKGIQGQTVGSRVMLTIPASDGYGKQGNPQAGIKGSDTLVFVVDVLGTVNPSASSS
ncbi:MAG: FKBP-type peptidyl-prolyl cis-trans isomerase [Streptosporangiales bacterium]|jgi:peptidylprolyl isomerase|nr:FKBP-type peptidyl-prolyl cis-trans isomerase [Streptosporangiales bacterium]